MPRYTSSVSPKGQITIPANIREQFGIDPKDRVSFEVIAEGILIKPVESPVDALYGSVPPLKEQVSWKELRAIVREERALNAMCEGFDHPDDETG